MRIVGDWFLFDDGESRPILRAKVWTARGTTVTEQFLVDTGADRTDMSVMGRDVLSNFHVIVSRPNSEVLLLAPRHRYEVLHT
jgi:hypothetical protein